MRPVGLVTHRPGDGTTAVLRPSGVDGASGDPDRAAAQALADELLAEADRLLGGRTNPALLDQYVRDAALDLWLRRPAITAGLAAVALQGARDAIARRETQPAGPQRRAGRRP